jgi:hypothetical protein
VPGGLEGRRTYSDIEIETPVCSLGDKRLYRREGIVLLSDEERELLAQMVGRERIMRERGVVQGERKVWYATIFGRLAILAAVLGGGSELLATIHQLLGGH